MTDIKLYGRIFISAKIKTITGLHIGGSGTGLEIGGINNEIIRNPLNNQPYIPGSSLKGKMRSQMERLENSPQNTDIGQAVIHTCKSSEEYATCPVCNVFGIPGGNPDEEDFSFPGRLIVRDVALTDKSVEELQDLRDLPFAEIKTEVTIDRVTSAAVPRSLERVPAGAVFGPAEMVYGIYKDEDFDRLKNVFEAMQLLEDDYLGGSGSRGSGKVKFKDIKISLRSGDNYSTLEKHEKFDEVQDILTNFDGLKNWAVEKIKAG